VPLETAEAPAATDAERVIAWPWFAGLGEAERLVAVATIKVAAGNQRTYGVGGGAGRVRCELYWSAGVDQEANRGAGWHGLPVRR
jgi:hypothetical protein